MKILIVGQWAFPVYEQAFGNALEAEGHEVRGFSWRGYFDSLLGRAEAKYVLAGPCTARFNRDLIETARRNVPNVLLAWRATSLLPSTLARLRKLGVGVLASYNHDDFTPAVTRRRFVSYHRSHWRLFLKSARHYDHHFVKRRSNVEHLEGMGCTGCHILPLWFVPELHRPVELTPSEKERYQCDAVFVGHYEPDGREAYLKALVHAGLHVRLFGGKSWTPQVLGDCADYFGPIREAHGEEYAKALSGAGMCLCFLSRLNRDTYTRRCFEIPACGSLLVSERTEDLQKFFKEDEEAVFFSSVEELVEKARWLKANPDTADRIAAAGMRRVHADGHSVTARTRQFLNLIGRSDGW